MESNADDGNGDLLKKQGTIRIGNAAGTLLTDSDEWWQPLSRSELAEWYGEREATPDNAAKKHSLGHR